MNTDFKSIMFLFIKITLIEVNDLIWKFNSMT